MNLSVKNPSPPQTAPVAANLTLSAAAEGSFISRHLGPSAEDIKVMLKTIGMPSLDALMEAVIPAGILAPVQAGYKTLRAEPAQSETEALAELSKKFTTFE